MIPLKKKPYTALFFFSCFIFFSALKLAVFNQLIVDAPATQALTNSFFSKVVLLFLLTLCASLPKKPVLFITVYCLQLLYMFVNVSYHFNFEGYLHVGQYIGLYSEALDLATHSAVPKDVRLLWLAIDFPFFVGMVFTYSHVSRLSTGFRVRTILYGAAMGLFFLMLRWEPKSEKIVKVMNDPYSSDIAVVRQYGLLTFNIVDMINYRDGQQHIRHIQYGPSLVSRDTAGPKPGIIALQVESLDAFIVDRKYGSEYIAPFLHELTSKSVYYPFMLSYHEAGASSDCEFSTINSVEPFEDLPSIKIRNYDYANSIIRPLTAGGYSVLAFHGNKGTYFNRIAAYKKMGFQHFFDMQEMGLREIGWGAPDKSVLGFVNAKLRTQKTPFFYYVITMSSHEPFTLTQSYYQNNTYATIPDQKTRDYFNSISYVDGQLREFVRAVRSENPNTLIAIWGDHTPVIAKNVYKRASFVYNNKPFEFVPLFILTPDGQVYRETKNVASFIDAAPTLLSFSKVPFAIKTNGNNLCKPPMKNSTIDYRGKTYSRSDLFSRIRKMQ